MIRISFYSFIAAMTIFSTTPGCASATKSDGGATPANASGAVDDLVPAASANSKAYQNALDEAFADMAQRKDTRFPAAVKRRAGIGDLVHDGKFAVRVYAKINHLGVSHKDSAISSRLSTASDYRFSVSQKPTCADFSASPDFFREPGKSYGPTPCLEVEIKPEGKAAHPHGRLSQFVRVFMDRDYRAYGFTFHEVNSQGQIIRHRKSVKWDPTEPLSSESLSLTREIAPLDLPIYASIGLRQVQETISIPQALTTCQGQSYKYRNTFGANVKAGWCNGDPWPSYVETNRYLAVLVRTAKN